MRRYLISENVDNSGCPLTDLQPRLCCGSCGVHSFNKDRPLSSDHKTKSYWISHDLKLSVYMFTLYIPETELIIKPLADIIAVQMSL